MTLKIKSTKLVFAASFFFLSSIHLYRMITNYGVNPLDISLLAMQLVIKMTYAAWDIHDYAVHLLKSQSERGKGEKLLSRYPSLTEYLGYVFNFIGIVGPATNFKDYLDWIDQNVSKKFYHNFHLKNYSLTF